MTKALVSTSVSTEEKTKSLKSIIITVAIVIVIAFSAIFLISGGLISNVDANEYQVKQAFMSGELSAHLTPGWYVRAMGKIYSFPKTETVYFERGREDVSSMGPVAVTFSDNSRCEISGTVRVIMPTSEQFAIDIVAKHSNRTFQDFAAKTVIPVTKRALITAATTMTASDAKIKMGDLATMGQDQLNNGIFVLESTRVEEKDPATGEIVRREVKHINGSAEDALKEKALGCIAYAALQKVLRKSRFDDTSPLVQFFSLDLCGEWSAFADASKELAELVLGSESSAPALSISQCRELLKSLRNPFLALVAKSQESF